jgi:hypothetical protein
MVSVSGEKVIGSLPDLPLRCSLRSAVAVGKAMKDRMKVNEHQLLQSQHASLIIVLFWESSESSRVDAEAPASQRPERQSARASSSQRQRLSHHQLIIAKQQETCMAETARQPASQPASQPARHMYEHKTFILKKRIRIVCTYFVFLLERR